MKAITYLIYILAWEFLVIGGCAYLVFWRGLSGAWFVLAIFLSACAYSPDRWNELFNGIKK